MKDGGRGSFDSTAKKNFFVAFRMCGKFTTNDAVKYGIEPCQKQKRHAGGEKVKNEPQYQARIYLVEHTNVARTNVVVQVTVEPSNGWRSE